MLSSLKAGRVIRHAPVRPRSLFRFATLAIFVASTLSFVPSAQALEVRLSDQKNQPIADAVVSLVPLGGPAKVTPPTEPAVVTQSGQEFSPYVTAVVVGSQVNFYNDDKVDHHVYSLSGAKRFDLPLSGGQTKKPVFFDKAGIVSVGCNIHEWMSAYVVVLATPFFATSNASGAAALSDVAAGRYRLEIWHPRLSAPDVREITLPTGSLALTLKLGADRRIRRSSTAPGAGSYK